jgi:hypothetical protein
LEAPQLVSLHQHFTYYNIENIGFGQFMIYRFSFAEKKSGKKRKQLHGIRSAQIFTHSLKIQVVCYA